MPVEEPFAHVASENGTQLHFSVGAFASSAGVSCAHPASRRPRSGPTKRIDFADYVIREKALDAGCSAVLTCDKAQLSEESFTEP
jgi:hypothetical protein